MTTMIITAYSLFVAVGVGVTLWVARKLDIHGLTFAKAGDRYDAETGPAMSHLLVVGFSLVALGIVSLALGIGSNAQTLQQCIESLSSKLGWVIMIIGLMHFTMLTVFAAMGRRLNPVTVRTGNAANEAEPAGTVHQLVKRLHEND